MGEAANTFESALFPAINLKKFSENRRKEIEIMRRALAASGSGTKLSFQKIPKHMRRRAMSHNAKRLPRRLREIHLNQMKKSGLPPKQKRPSRKYRRKPRNLLEEYTKRQSKYRWLNTHIWHAKRFHMIEKWGFRLPEYPCDKAFTACYRATKNYCLLQDISYVQCIEISGKTELITDCFGDITDKTIGLPIGSKAFIDGLREGEVTLYQYGVSPKKAIGTVQFLWKYKDETHEHDGNTLWLWIHAAFYKEALDTLVNCLNLVQNENKHFTNDEGLTLIELKDELNRFRLSGNLSNSVLHSCLRIYDSNNSLSEWLQSFRRSRAGLLKNQNEYWDKLKFISSTNNLSPHIILPLIICDPRLNFNIVKQTECNSDINSIDNTSPSATSPLWDSEQRKDINSSKVLNKEIEKLHNNLLIPMEDITELGTPVAIILIQRPGNRADNLGYSSGWDIILPASWAQPLWVSLIMNGARSGGLRESQCNNFESGKPNDLYPDTMAGETQEQNITIECYTSYFRKPPNKRTNFNKLKIVSPFKADWKLLISNWLDHPVNNFTVLRDKNKLRELQACIRYGRKSIELPDNCLIPVQIECSKGSPKPFTIICLPKVGDLKKSPVENNCVDPNQKKRRIMRIEHKTMLKKLRQRRKKSNQSGTVVTNDVNVEELKKYSVEMKKLWLPEAENIRNSCSREICGFVTEGGYSFTLGRAKGIGFIVGATVNALINSGNKDKVLMRNTNSRQYFVAKLSVITEL